MPSWHLCGSWNPNSGSLAFPANALTAEPSPLHCFFNFYSQIIMINQNEIKLAAAGRKCWRVWLRASCASCNKRVRDHTVSRGPGCSLLHSTLLWQLQLLAFPKNYSWKKLERPHSLDVLLKVSSPWSAWIFFYSWQLWPECMLFKGQRVSEMDATIVKQAWAPFEVGGLDELSLKLSLWMSKDKSKILKQSYVSWALF